MINDAPEKMALTSMDVAEEKRAQLKRLFPEVFTDGYMDFEQLRRVMGDWVEPGKERYGLNWPGKAECMKIIQAPSIATLKPAREESVDFDNTENLFIEGDNLEVLKLLQKAYFGKIKMIYIDPPYNTGKEFIYPDKYQENLDTYLNYTGQLDGDGRKFSTNTDAGGRYHSRWLSMMFPRLYLAKNLLREDGFICISIDDNEFPRLKMICDLIFGEENFIDNIIWKKRYGGGAKEKYLVSLHEYILVYARNISSVPEIFVPLQQDSIDRYYKFRDEHFETKGPYRTHPLEAMKSFDERENLKFPIKAPNGELVYPKRQWRWSKERVQQALNRNEIEFNQKTDGSWSLYSKQYLKKNKGEIRKTKAFSIIEDVYTQHGTNEIVSIFGDAKVFDFPKPTALIEQIINIGTLRESGDIVLDFFAGSAATAHAVLKANLKDNGNRKFIMVQLPEPCPKDSAAFKLGLFDIASIGKERLRRERNLLSKGQRKINDSKDIGFKAFSLSSSNFNIWDGVVENIDDLTTQLEMHIDHIDQESEPEDILYELLLKTGFTLTTKIEKQTIAGKNVYSVADGALLICLDKEITPELIDALAGANPLQVICLDEGFKGNDQLKTNAVQTFKSRAASREMEIVFRTV